MTRLIELPESKDTEIIQINIGCRCKKCGKVWGFELSHIGPMSMVCNDCLYKKLRDNHLLPEDPATPIP
jgi:hypothetical protein